MRKSGAVCVCVCGSWAWWKALHQLSIIYATPLVNGYVSFPILIRFSILMSRLESEGQRYEGYGERESNSGSLAGCDSEASYPLSAAAEQIEVIVRGYMHIFPEFINLSTSLIHSA